MYLQLSAILLVTTLGLGLSPLSSAQTLNSKEIETLANKAAKGDMESQNTLGSMYEKGLGVDQDYGHAFVLYEKAAKQGHPYAQNNLAFLYGQGLGVSQDYGKARKWIEKAAAQGSSYSQNNVGTLYEKGFGFIKDIGVARQWYKKSCAKGLQKGCDNYRRTSAL